MGRPERIGRRGLRVRDERRAGGHPRLPRLRSRVGSGTGSTSTESAGTAVRVDGCSPVFPPAAARARPCSTRLLAGRERRGARRLAGDQHLGVPAAWVTGYYSLASCFRTAACQARSRSSSASRPRLPLRPRSWCRCRSWRPTRVGALPHCPGARPSYLWRPRAGVTLGLLSLPREGGVSYVTDADVDRDPAVLTRHRVAITADHGEYWAKGTRDAFESARGPARMLFMGANTGYWQVRYENGVARWWSRTHPTRGDARPETCTFATSGGRRRSSACSTTRARTTGRARTSSRIRTASGSRTPVSSPARRSHRS